MAVPLGEKGHVTDAGLPGWGLLQPDLDDNPELRFPRSVEVYSRMRREETQLQSVLRAVKFGSHQFFSASSYVSVACVCIISTCGSSLPSFTLKSTSPLAAESISSFA